MQPAIKVSQVIQAFGRKTPIKNTRHVVLDGIDFQVLPGEIVCLLGPSGCGKTTLIDLIIGNTVPVSGTVEVLGERAPYPTARQRVGYMPQGSALYEDITGQENLRFFGTMNKMTRAQIDERVPVLLDFVRLSDHAKKLVSAYSGGMKQRLSLAVALIHDPDVLVLDEPTVGIDPAHRASIWDEFGRLADQGKSILVTTHIMDEAVRCHRVVILHGGKVLASAAPQEILDQTGTTDLEQAFLKLEQQAREEEQRADHA